MKLLWEARPEFKLRYYEGLIYYDPNKDVCKVTFFPLSIILALGRSFWLRVRYYRHRSWYDKALKKARQDGYEAGLRCSEGLLAQVKGGDVNGQEN